MKEKYKVAVIGPAGVGKTTIVHQFVYNNYVEVYDPTIEETYKKSFFCGGAHVDLEIVDTAGKEHFPGMLDRYIESADAFLLVYSISDARSFSQIYQLFSRIASIRGPIGIARMLVGAQCDSAKREIDHDDGAQLSAQVQCSFAEVSAKHNINIVEIFDELVAQMRYLKNQDRNRSTNTLNGKGAILPMAGPHPDQWYIRKKESWCCFM
ncbi:unnamed protein product, partial [Mesorhabditis belari]|uniref:Uncharacterized protein n=1 Tax=Mesorhabditis belari TaxID=2138241 RepID=A0AAF3FCK1_9BILA